MALTSVGYAGPIEPAEWADLTAGLGTDYGVVDAGHWKVTTVAGQDRTVSIAAGRGFGKGVLDITDAAETVQLSTVGSGSRWDTIVARRTWATPETTFVGLQGTSSRALSASRLVGAGTTDDQPIALVQITAGQQLPTAVVDLRCWRGNGGVYATSTDALAYLGSAGSVVWVGGVQWVRQVASNDVLSWVAGSPLEVSGGALHGSYAGQQVKRYVRRGTFTTNSDGDVAIMTASQFNGVLTASLVGVSTFPIITAVRISGGTGNLIARMWDLSGLRTNTSFSGLADVTYW